MILARLLVILIINSFAQAIEDERPVMFVHISNSAGTALCRSFVKSGVRTPDLKKNCNAKCTLPWHWQRFCNSKYRCKRLKCQPSWGSSQRDLCANMLKYASRENLDLIGREMFLEEVSVNTNFTVCKQFKYFMIFKEPVTRISSNLNRLVKNPKNTVKKWLHDERIGRPALVKNLLNDMSGTPSLNNYVTRILLGEDAFFSGKMSLQSNNMERHAMYILDQFELVVPAEMLGTVQAISLISNLWGKHEELNKTLARFLARRLNHRQHTNALDDESMEILVQANALDIRLHKSVKEKFESMLRNV